MSTDSRPAGKHFASAADGRAHSLDRDESASSAGEAAPVAPASRPRPDETAVFLAAAASRTSSPAGRRPAGAHVRGAERAGLPDASERAGGEPAGADAVERAAGGDDAQRNADKSSNMVSVLVIISRITGFVRTSAQAWALGVTGLASTYTVANAMPNTLYELVVGGMLITSFLPVYLKVKKSLGREGASAYASNLLSLVMVLMGLLTVVSFICAAPIIWTQSAGAAEDFDFGLSVWFFRWFVCEIILYALSSIISGVLNAERDYLASNVAPILNNVITIGSFALYGYLVNTAGVAWSDAVIVLAAGNPLGVAAQVVAQVPALRRHGVRLRLRIDLHDPAIRETLSIGLPTLAVTFASFPTTAVMSSCALSITAAGASIAYYARVWYVLPFSIFAIPISTTMFTELSSCRVRGDDDGFVSCLSAGTRKILFTLIPFTMYFQVFATPLIAVFASGSFSAEAFEQTVGYLQALSFALPFYGLSSYLQKVCSSMLRMKFYAFSTCIAAVVQIVLCLWLTPVFGLYVVPISSTFFYGVIDLVTFARLRSELGHIGIRSVLVSAVRALALGLAGSVAGWAILQGLGYALGPCEGAVRGILYAAAGGIPALIVTFGLGYALGMSDAPFFDALFSKVLRRRPVRAA